MSECCLSGKVREGTPYVSFLCSCGLQTLSQAFGFLTILTLTLRVDHGADFMR
jgi:hypothetical protein